MNPVVHFDIPVTDLQKSAAFYSALFGWKIDEIPNANYAMVTTTDSDPNTGPKKPGAINGGMGLRSNAPTLTQPYLTVQVDDIQATLESVVAAGGAIVRPLTDMGDWGKMAVFQDPEGNAIGLFSK